MRGNMNLRLLIAQASADTDEDTTGLHKVVFTGLGQESNVAVSLSGGLENASFVDAIIKLKWVRKAR